MKKIYNIKFTTVLTICLIVFCYSTNLVAQPNLIWQKTYGGSLVDHNPIVINSSDGGYVIAGTSISKDGNITSNKGNNDFWVIKVNSKGDIEWQKNYGGSQSDVIKSIAGTWDKGYILCGVSMSNDGDASTTHWQGDYLIIKIKSDGTIDWKKCYGGSDLDEARSIYPCHDGGYVIAGNTKSIDNDITKNHGSSDYWIVKINYLGDIVWQKTFGGTKEDYATSVIETKEKEFLVSGYTLSNNGDVTNHYISNDTIKGNKDVWVLKLDSTGNLLWQKIYGGNNDDYSNNIIQTIDGGYLFTGATNSNNGDVADTYGFLDVWVVKLNKSGIIQWQKCIGGSNDEEGTAVVQLGSEDYLISGGSNSNDQLITSNKGNSDFVLIKLNSSGYLIWEKNYGGKNYDKATSLVLTSDKGCILAGNTDSNDGDVSNNKGTFDYWLVKIDNVLDVEDYLISNSEFNIYPNPNNGNFKLSIDNLYINNKLEFEITDILGKTLIKGNIENVNNEINTNLSKGIYFFKLKSNNNINVKKILIQ